MKKIILGIFKLCAALVLACIIFVVGCGLFFFATSRFEISPKQLRWAIQRFVPSSMVDLTFADLKLDIERPPGLFFAKRIGLHGTNVCVRYESEAAITCVSEIKLGLTGGWGGKGSGETHGRAIIPHLIEIEPIVITGTNARIDITRFPKTEKKPKPKSSFDIVNFIRTEVLPRWKIDGSHIELQSFLLKMDNDTSYAARFDLSTESANRLILVNLHEFRDVAGPLFAKAQIKLIRPELLGGAMDKAWVVAALGEVQLDKKKTVRVDAHADIASWRALKFQVATYFKGIAALKELKFNGALDEPNLNAKVSLKMGTTGAEVQALDFVDCSLSAKLDKKTGNLVCGPETVRLKLTEKAFLHKPEFFTLSPAFDFRLTNLEFDADKAADFEVDIKLNHMNILAFSTEAKGHFEKKADHAAQYSVNAQLALVSDRFSRIVKLLQSTPYSVPAPMNQLEGPIDLHAKVNLTERGGDIQYQSATRLDSEFQAVHMRLSGATQLIKTASSFSPSTDATLFIDDVHVSAPRFDLRVPPKLNPDSRFGKLDQPQKTIVIAKHSDTLDKPVEKAPEKPSQPMDVKLHIQTTKPHAVMITTNLTRAPIPIDLDLLYQQAKAKPAAAPLTGKVVVGRTPVEVFRRNATLEELQLEFLADGNDHMDANISVDYLDYNIQINIAGRTTAPQIRLSSDPVLDRNQILSVLVFGRTLNELGDEEKSSVGNLNAAFADAALGLTSLYFLASTPIENVGYDPTRGLVTAQVGIGGGASLEFGSGSDGSAVGFKKRLSKDFAFRSDVERLSATGKRTVSALVEWVKRF